MQPPGRIYTPAPLARHPLNKGRLVWLSGLMPEKVGGPDWFGVAELGRAVLTSSPLWIGTPYGAGLTFDGSTNYGAATLPTAVSGPFAAAAWVKGSNSADFAVPFGSQNPNVWYTQRTGSGMTVAAYSGDNTFHQINLTGVFDDTWHRVSCVFTGSDWRAYLEGRFVNNSTCASAVLGAFGNTWTDFDIGSLGGGNKFAGSLADPSAWSISGMWQTDPDGWAALEFDQSLRNHPDTLRRSPSRRAAIPLGGPVTFPVTWRLKPNPQSPTVWELHP